MSSFGNKMLNHEENLGYDHLKITKDFITLSFSVYLAHFGRGLIIKFKKLPKFYLHIALLIPNMA